MSEQTDHLWDPGAQVRDPQVAALEEALRAYRYAPVSRALSEPTLSRWRMVRAPAIAAALLIVGSTTLLLRPAKWSIRVEGTATLSSAPVTSKSRFRPGDLLVTGVGSAASVKVGGIGDVRVGPGSTLRLDAADPMNHRFALERGEIHARIWAKPRVFEVATARARAIDLGCVYMLRVGERGETTLEVYYGAVELVGARDGTLVPSGNGASVDENGSSVPWPLASTQAFRQAAMQLSSGAPDVVALAAVLAGADAPATITLWHLLPRAHAGFRSAIAIRLMELSPIPAGVARDRVLTLDSASLAAWEAQLRPQWSAEPENAWRRFLVKWRLAKPRAVLTLPGGSS